MPTIDVPPPLYYLVAWFMIGVLSFYTSVPIDDSFSKGRFVDSIRADDGTDHNFQQNNATVDLSEVSKKNPAPIHAEPQSACEDIQGAITHDRNEVWKKWQKYLSENQEFPYLNIGDEPEAYTFVPLSGESLTIGRGGPTIQIKKFFRNHRNVPRAACTVQTTTIPTSSSEDSEVTLRLRCLRGFLRVHAHACPSNYEENTLMDYVQRGSETEANARQSVNSRLRKSPLSNQVHRSATSIPNSSTSCPDTTPRISNNEASEMHTKLSKINSLGDTQVFSNPKQRRSTSYKIMPGSIFLLKPGNIFTFGNSSIGAVFHCYHTSVLSPDLFYRPRLELIEEIIRNRKALLGNAGALKESLCILLEFLDNHTQITTGGMEASSTQLTRNSRLPLSEPSRILSDSPLPIQVGSYQSCASLLRGVKCSTSFFGAVQHLEQLLGVAQRLTFEENHSNTQEDNDRSDTIVEPLSTVIEEPIVVPHRETRKRTVSSHKFAHEKPCTTLSENAEWYNGIAESQVVIYDH